MAKKPPSQVPARATELCVSLSADLTAVDRLAAALGAASIASVIIEPPAGGVLDASNARPLVELAQAHGAAALISGDAALARALRADGVHLPPTARPLEAYTEAREVLGNRYIVGAHAGKSRHDAMSLGEAGADYVAFGAPDSAQDRPAAIARRLDLVGWWSEIFEVSGVALDVETLDAAADLAEAGADFIAFALPTALPPADVAERIAQLAELLAEVNARREAVA